MNDTNELAIIRMLRAYPDWEAFENEPDRTTLANEKKRQLLALPAGSKRPNKPCPLGRAICDYTSKMASTYDAEFDRAIRAKQPDWFVSQTDRADEKKRQLLALPPGSIKPHHTTQLGLAIYTYTNQTDSYDPEFDKAIRAKQPDWFVSSSDRASEKKRQLLALLARSERPYRTTALGIVLCSYTSKRTSSYDPEFDSAIREKQPQWFKTDRISEKKRQLLALPAGSERPSLLGQTLHRYTSKMSSTYDAEFDRAIRAKQPGWFASRTDRANEKKQQLLAMPVGSTKPHHATPLGLALFSYTYTNDASSCYDPEFDKAIRAKQPGWFISPSDRANEKKRQLLALPAGSIKPHHTTPLGLMLRSYTSNRTSSYDPEFDKAIRAKQPGWFVSPSTKTDEKKRRLLALPVGSEKPRCKARLALSRYTNETSDSYDPEFDKAIRAKQPGWFVSQIDRANEKKRQLLALPAGSKKPQHETPLRKVLHSYTSRRTKCYDPEFDKAIRAKQPDWFVSPSDRASEKKRQLLALPAGCERPHWQSPLGVALRRYITKVHGCYDSEFDKAIREGQPHWFA